MAAQQVDEDDFGALFEESMKKPRKRYAPGDRVSARILQVGAERLVLDLGEGLDGLMELQEFGDERPVLQEGDVVDAFILGFEDRIARVGLRAGRGAGRMQLDDAQRTGVPVQGLVTEVNKGGYVVEVGGTRAFCPLGAMDVRRIEDPSVMIGRKLEFRVTEMRGGRDAVLSRRVLLEEENARRAKETRESLVVGARLKGTISAVREFGAFVDLGGIEGLVPVSELGWARTRAQDAVREGQLVDVEIVRMETPADGRERITLSMKALADDPFRETVARLQPGMIVAGTVSRVQPFGAFVEIVPGVDGLIHVSAFGRRVAHPADAVKPGQRVAVRVEGVDPDARRISLHLADAAELEGAGDPPSTPATPHVLRHPEPPKPRAEPAEGAPAAPARPALALPRVGDIVEGTVDRVEKYGLFVSWPAGRGLVPGRELAVPRSADLRKQFPEGAKLRVAVIDIRDDGKITLSQTAVERAEERATTDAYMNESRGAAPKGLGTLGDLLQAKRKR